jgi:flagellar basal-body rod protein FlgB
MIDRIFAGAAYEGSKKLMDAAVVRHEIVASNLANLETPGFKRSSLPKDFDTVFRAALNEGKLSGLSVPTAVVDLESPAQRKDGNNVVMQDELMAMNKNAAEYEALSEFVSGTIKTLRMAVVGHAQ